jgi:uncharacterized damage-inducible protein DinB
MPLHKEEPTMHRSRVFAAMALAATLITAAPVAADEATPPVSGIRGEILQQIADAESKLVDLAGAMPAGKYSWRPGKDVRSVAEVFMHVAAGNYAIPGFGGYKSPEGVDPMSLEKNIPARDQVIETLKHSFAFVRTTVSAVPDADLDKPVTLFGGMQTTMRGMLLLLATHSHEHLGQSIAYARMNGVVPPWTAERQAKAKPAEAKKSGS